MKRTVLFITGGRSEEHEISLISTKCVLDAIDRDRFEPIVVAISKEGKWYYHGDKTFYTGEIRADKIKLSTDAPLAFIRPFSNNRRGAISVENKIIEFDVAFPLMHGIFAEDGTIQGMLEIMGVPFVGSTCTASAICLDKTVTKAIAAQHGIDITPYVIVSDTPEIDTLAGKIEEFGFPLFVKPNRTGSSVGVSKVDDFSQLHGAIENALMFDSKCLIEQGMVGREIETAVLGNGSQIRVALPGEVIPNAKIGWYSYEAKYLLDDGARVEVPAKLERHHQHQLQAFAERVFIATGCDGMARIDVFFDEAKGKIVLNEANTIPGFTPISMYPKMWEATGINYTQLITELIELGIRRTAGN